MATMMAPSPLVSSNLLRESLKQVFVLFSLFFVTTCIYFHLLTPFTIFLTPPLPGEQKRERAKDVDLSSPENLEIIANVKLCLSHAVLPVPGLLSPSIQKTRNSAPYHLDFWRLLYGFFSENDEETPGLYVITHSIMSALETKEFEERTGMGVRCARLSEIESENRLRELFEGHLAPTMPGWEPKEDDDQESKTSEILVMQFDPTSSNSKQMFHANFLCTQALNRRNELLASLSPSPPPSRYRRPIVFLVHLPPALRDRQRFYVLDYQKPWKYFYVDELEDTSSRPIEHFLRTPIHQLSNEGLIDLLKIIFSKLPRALTSARTQFDRPCHVTMKERLWRLKDRIRNHPGFQKFFVGLVYGVLENKGTAREVSLLLHTSLAIREKHCGTVWVSIEKAIEAVVMQATASTILYLEKNNNLSTLRFGADRWLRYAANPNIFGPEALFLTAKIGGRKEDEGMYGRVALNTGRLGALVARFPFSHSIATLLDGGGGGMRREIEERGGSGGVMERFVVFEKALWGIAQGLFGEELVSEWKKFGREVEEEKKRKQKEGPKKTVVKKKEWKKLGEEREKEEETERLINYFHDFVGLCGMPCGDMSHQEQKLVFRTLFECCFPGQKVRDWMPPQLHAAFWANEKRMQNILTLLSLVPPETKAYILRMMDKAISEEEEEEVSGGKKNKSLLVFLWFLYETAIDSVWCSFRMMHTFHEIVSVEEFTKYESELWHKYREKEEMKEAVAISTYPYSSSSSSSSSSYIWPQNKTAGHHYEDQRRITRKVKEKVEREKDKKRHPPWCRKQNEQITPKAFLDSFPTVEKEMEKCVSEHIPLGRLTSLADVKSLITTLKGPLSLLIEDIMEVLGEDFQKQKEKKKEKGENGAEEESQFLTKKGQRTIYLSLKKRWDSIWALHILNDEVLTPSHRPNSLGPLYKKFLKLRKMDFSLLNTFDWFVFLVVEIQMVLGTCWDCGGPSILAENVFLCRQCINKRVREADAKGTWRKQGEIRDDRRTFAQIEHERRMKIMEFDPNFRLLQIVGSRLVNEVVLPEKRFLGFVYGKLPAEGVFVKHLDRLVNSPNASGLRALTQNREYFGGWRGKVVRLEEPEQDRLQRWREERTRNNQEKEAIRLAWVKKHPELPASKFEDVYEKMKTPEEKKLENERLEKNRQENEFFSHYSAWKGRWSTRLREGLEQFELLSSLRSSIMFRLLECEEEMKVEGLVSLSDLPAKRLFLRSRVGVHEEILREREARTRKEEYPRDRLMSVVEEIGGDGVVGAMLREQGKGNRKFLEMTAQLQVVLGRYAVEVVHPAPPPWAVVEVEEEEEEEEEDSEGAESNEKEGTKGKGKEKEGKGKEKEGKGKEKEGKGKEKAAAKGKEKAAAKGKKEKSSGSSSSASSSGSSSSSSSKSSGPSKSEEKTNEKSEETAVPDEEDFLTTYNTDAHYVESSTKFHQLFNKILFKKGEEFQTPWLRTYVLKSIRALSGLSGVAYFLQRALGDPELDWLKGVDAAEVEKMNESGSLSFGTTTYHPRGDNDSVHSDNIRNAFEGLMVEDTGTKEYKDLMSKLQHKNTEDRLRYYTLPAIFESFRSLGKEYKEKPSFGEALGERLTKKADEVLKTVFGFRWGMRPLGGLVARACATMFLGCGTPGKFYVPLFSKRAISEEDSLLIQVQTRLAFIAAIYPKSWVATLMMKPSLMVQKVLPSSVIDLQMSEHLKWF